MPKELERVTDDRVAVPPVVAERPVALPDRHVREVDGEALLADPLDDVPLHVAELAAAVVEELRQVEEAIFAPRSAPVDDAGDAAVVDEHVVERVVPVHDVAPLPDRVRVALNDLPAPAQQLPALVGVALEGGDDAVLGEAGLDRLDDRLRPARVVVDGATGLQLVEL